MQASTLEAPSRVRAGNRPAKILLVDDEARNLDVLESILQSPDYELVRVQGGGAALLALVQSDFACIVLDVHMPEMTGIELARLIKTRKRSQHIPIIFLTAYFQEEKDVLQGYGAGAVDYLTKPVNPQILKSKVGVFVELFRTTHALAAANAALELEIHQRETAEQALHQVNLELEERVKERTADVKHAYEGLRQSEERFRMVADNIVALAWTADRLGWATWYNQRWYEYTGTTYEEMQERGWERLHHPDHNERVKAGLAKCLESGELWEDTFPLLGRDGHYRWFLSRAMPIRDEEGNIRRWFGTNTDITEWKETQVALQQQKQRLEIINRIGTTLAAELDLPKLVQAVTDAGREVSGAKFGAFFYNVKNEQGEAYALYTLSGTPREAFEKLGMPRKTPIFAPTYDGLGTVRVADIQKDPRYGQMGPHHGMPKGHWPIRSYLAVPVVSRSGQVLGGLLFGHPEPGIFGPESESVLAAIAAQAAVAMDNARLYQAVQHELNEHKRAEAALRESEQRYRQLIRGLPLALYTTDAEGRIRLYNEAAVALWGREPEIGLDLSSWLGSSRILRPDGAKLPRDQWPMAMAIKEGRALRDQEIVIERPDGTRRNVLPYPDPIRDADGAVVGATNMMVDITERKLAEEEIRRARDELEVRVRERTAELGQTNEELRAQIRERKQLEAVVLDISEREQQRIGKDLHDGLCQHLIGIKFKSRVLEQKLTRRGLREARDAHVIEELLSGAVEQARGQAHGLSPVRLETDGLMAALHELTAGISSLFRLQCGCSSRRPVPIGDHGVAIHLYRIAQEAITNAIRHGRAKRINVQLFEQQDQIRLAIHDNGAGFPKRPTKQPGMGLAIMNYRARTIGATLSVRPRPGGGITVLCCLPGAAGPDSKEP